MKQLVVIVRNDLDPGLQLAQSGHAVAAFAYEHPEPFREWHGGERNIVCLQARDEAHLNELIAQLDTSALVSKFYEPDLGDALTAFATDSRHKTWSSLPRALKRFSSAA
jgi:peptidyl-tRNA hydrolase